MKDDRYPPNPPSYAALIPGLIVLGIGVVFLLDNLGIFHIYDIWRFWPLILIAIGATKLVDSLDHRAKTGGAIMVIIGGLFLASNFGLFSWSIWQFWPVILIGAGLMMLVDRTGARLFAAVHIRPGDRIARADSIAIFSGLKRQVTTEDFRGANYVAIFGGGEIDLRRAQIQTESATIEITAVFGGFELRVPSNWIVVNEVVGIFGGASDETLPPLPELPNGKRLFVRGAAIFGGVGIKN